MTQKTRGILDAVRVGGDQAILRYTSMFDGVDFPSSRRLRVSRREIEAGIRRCDAGGMSALRLATKRIERFHRAKPPKSLSLNRRGEELGQRVYPIARVGLYVPGGRAVYPSTVLMAGIPARIAGVPERVMCTPPDSEGRIDPWVVAAADLAGITEIYRVGGVGIGNSSSCGKLEFRKHNVVGHYLWTKVYVADNYVDLTGRNNIIARVSKDAVYERNTLANSSRYSTGHSIFCFNTDGIKIQFNEAYGNVGEGGIDRGGFDADYNCVNTFIQYNYSHDNLWFCGIMKKKNRNVVIRYNLSQNDKEGIYFYGLSLIHI